MVIFEIASAMYMLEEFQEIYGMRFVGLADAGGSVYSTYRVPDPEAPFPQDVIIDQDGIIRYWSWEYDPQEVIDIIDDLLGSTGVWDEAGGGGSRVLLSLPKPTPFRGETTLRFQLPQPGAVRVRVTDATGRLVRSLLGGTRSAGVQVVKWNGRDERDIRASSGVYYISLSAGSEEMSRRVVLLK